MRLYGERCPHWRELLDLVNDSSCISCWRVNCLHFLEGEVKKGGDKK